MNPERRQPTREELAVCAHDLRGALTVISGYVDLLRRLELSDAERAEALAGINAAVRRADRLLGDTLSGKSHESAAPGDRVDLVALSLRAAEDARAAFGREVAVETAGSQLMVPGDADALARVLENLLSNAAKYAPTGPIEIRLTEEAGSAVVEIADRGPGIPADQREDVFEPFARLPRDDDAPGTGLGLTVVRSVAERLGGHAEVRDRDGGGAIVRVELPLI